MLEAIKKNLTPNATKVGLFFVLMTTIALGMLDGYYAFSGERRAPEVLASILHAAPWWVMSLPINFPGQMLLLLLRELGFRPSLLVQLLLEMPFTYVLSCIVIALVDKTREFGSDAGAN